MLLEDVRFLFCDKRRNPHRRFESTRANLFENGLDISTESGSGFQPVAHSRLITIVDLNVFEAGHILRDEVEIIENLLCGDAGTEAIPGAPSGRRGLATQGWMILNELIRHLR